MKVNLPPPANQVHLVVAIILLVSFLLSEVGALWVWCRYSRRAETPPKVAPVEPEEAHFRPPKSPGRGATREEREALQVRLAGLRDDWAARVERAKPIPASQDFLVALAEMRERLHSAAERRGVRIGAAVDSFGFATFAHEPPPIEVRPAIERQRHAVEVLLNVLLEAQPHALLAVQRETPRTGERISPWPSKPGGLSPQERAETLSLSPDRSGGTPAGYQSAAFRFSFSGETQTLRSFLNAIAGGEWPAVIREVEAAPATPAEVGQKSTANRAGRPLAGHDVRGAVISGEPALKKIGVTTPRGVVNPQISRFTVTLEWIEAVPPAAVGT